LKRYDSALAALAGFNETSDSKYMESVFYFRGEAFFETGQYAQSIQSLEILLTRWPESAFYFEAKLEQGRAYAAAGQNTEAVRALSDILNFATDDLLVHRASLELGRAQTDPAEKLASFQRVALLADAAKPEQAALIQQALTESLPLYLALNRPQDVLTDSDRLIKEFPMSGKTAELHSWRVKADEQLIQKNRTADNAN
jgi:tetratricopeptide (TPR) repeat protein